MVISKKKTFEIMTVFKVRVDLLCVKIFLELREILKFKA